MFKDIYLHELINYRFMGLCVENFTQFDEIAKKIHIAESMYEKSWFCRNTPVKKQVQSSWHCLLYELTFTVFSNNLQGNIEEFGTRLSYTSYTEP